MTLTALVHAIAALALLGYAQNYYFHLRMSLYDSHPFQAANML